ncbi:MAG: mechanosensitive ion channel, partial [Alphaproteobacteria bacterium]
MGFVQSLNARSTLLLSPEGNHVQIPNATVFKNIIVNFSTAPVRRETFRVGIGYDASITQAQTIVLDAIESHQAILRDPAPLVLVQDLGSSTVVLEVQDWFDGQAFSQARVRSAILRLAKKALVDAGISMPDDAREVIFPEGLPLRRWSGTDAAAPAEAPAPPAAESAA